MWPTPTPTLKQWQDNFYEIQFSVINPTSIDSTRYRRHICLAPVETKVADDNKTTTFNTRQLSMEIPLQFMGPNIGGMFALHSWGRKGIVIEKTLNLIPDNCQ